MVQGLTNQICNSIPGMRVVAIYSRKPQRGHDVFGYSGQTGVVDVDTQGQLDKAIAAGVPAVTEDAFLLARSDLIDVIVDVTGSVEFGAHVALEAFRHQKTVVLMNAEIDATIGPILQVYAKKYGGFLSACDGDEPGVQMNWSDGSRGSD